MLFRYQEIPRDRRMRALMEILCRSISDPSVSRAAFRLDIFERSEFRSFPAAISPNKIKWTRGSWWFLATQRRKNFFRRRTQSGIRFSLALTMVTGFRRKLLAWWATSAPKSCPNRTMWNFIAHGRNAARRFSTFSFVAQPNRKRPRGLFARV